MVRTNETVLLQPGQLDETGAMLGRAFFDDPLNVYVFPDEERRARVLPWILRLGTNYGQKYGEVHTTDESVEGAAVWLPPGGTQTSVLRMLLLGAAAAPFKAGLAAIRRFLTVTNRLDHLHERDMPPEHWYLMILGVDPERQGQGVGGRLIQPILSRADGDGLPCYLETMKEINVTFYRKHGFEVVSEGEIPDEGGPHYWTMRRDPKS